MARTKTQVRADHKRARAGGQLVRRPISKQAARMMSFEEVEAAHLQHEVREPARDRACMHWWTHEPRNEARYEPILVYEARN